MPYTPIVMPPPATPPLSGESSPILFLKRMLTAVDCSDRPRGHEFSLLVERAQGGGQLPAKPARAGHAGVAGITVIRG